MFRKQLTQVIKGVSEGQTYGISASSDGSQLITLDTRKLYNIHKPTDEALAPQPIRHYSPSLRRFFSTPIFFEDTRAVESQEVLANRVASATMPFPIVYRAPLEESETKSESFIAEALSSLNFLLSLIPRYSATKLNNILELRQILMGEFRKTIGEHPAQVDKVKKLFQIITHFERDEKIDPAAAKQLKMAKERSCRLRKISYKFTLLEIDKNLGKNLLEIAKHPDVDPADRKEIESLGGSSSVKFAIEQFYLKYTKKAFLCYPNDFISTAQHFITSAYPTNEDIFTGVMLHVLHNAVHPELASGPSFCRRG